MGGWGGGVVLLESGPQVGGAWEGARSEQQGERLQNKSLIKAEEWGVEENGEIDRLQITGIEGVCGGVRFGIWASCISSGVRDEWWHE